MTKQHDEKEPSFKVVDRRRFTDDGDEVNESEQEEKSAPSSLDDGNDASLSNPSSRPAMTFEFFVQSLAHQSMMGLGLVPWPDSGLVKVDLQLAKETIDILKIIKEKTVNNLDANEQLMIDSLVYQLQIAFVEIARMPPPEPGNIVK